MIRYFDRAAVLDPVGADSGAVIAALYERGIDNPPQLLVQLLSDGAGGTFPFVLESGPAAGRAFSEIITLDELTGPSPDLRADLTVVAIGGGGDMLLIGPDGQCWAEIADRSGWVSRSLHLVARSVEELILKLVPDDGVLDDMVEYALDEGFPERPAEVIELRRRWERAD